MLILKERARNIKKNHNFAHLLEDTFSVSAFSSFRFPTLCEQCGNSDLRFIFAFSEISEAVCSAPPSERMTATHLEHKWLEMDSESVDVNTDRKACV